MKEYKINLPREYKIDLGLYDPRPDLELYEPIVPDFCEYTDDCQKICNSDKQKMCRISKFYKRYGKNWKELGI